MNRHVESSDTLTITSLSPSPPRFSRHGSGAVVAVVAGESTGQTLSLDEQPVTVGTSRECDLVLSDPQVSRKHLRIVWKRKRAHLTDLESKNGSFHDGQRFSHIDLVFGDQITVGKCVLKLLPRENEVAGDDGLVDATTLGSLVGATKPMRELYGFIDQVAPSNESVLIEGETGSGKELVAEEIHRRSHRRDRPFMVFDCGAVPRELIESALFGHVRGAFTGASQDRSGVFDEANGGTVFLDEIGELRTDLQPALLRVLDRGMVRRVGESQFRQVDVRVIAATHRNLAEKIADGTFREDLYYRLAVIRLSVPPLRERRDDILLLARHFLRQAGRPDIELDNDTLAKLHAHSWPGNVRELRNVVARGIAMSTRGTLVLDRLGADRLVPQKADEGPRSVGFGADGARIPFRDAKAAAIEAFERAYLSELIAMHDTVTAAAEDANMDRKHLRTLLRRYNLV